MNLYILMLIILSICNSAFSKGIRQPKALCQPIEVGVYYESHDYLSINFITNQFKNLGGAFYLITKLDFVPWGRTTYNQADNTFTCTNGPEECHADRIHACASYLHSNTPKQLLQFIQCTVKHELWRTNSAEAANQCANQVDGWVDAYPDIEFCSVMNDTVDIGIFLNMRDKTNNLSPPLSNVPTVTINGNQRTDVLTDLIQIINSEFYGQDCQFVPTQKPECQPVQVGVYYESHNDDSLSFLGSQFSSLGDAFYLITKLDFVPWGRATYNQADNTFTCINGPEECHADRIHACAEYYHTNTPQQLVQFIQCTAQHPDWKTNSAESANECANQVDGWVDAFPQIEMCSVMNDTTDVNIFLAHRDKTNTLNPPLSNVPIVTINGNQRTDVLTDLNNVVSNAFYSQDCQFTPPPTPDPQCKAIDVGVYYESFDQNSLNFINSQFSSIKPAHIPYINIDWVPWGRASYDQVSNAFTCTNGPEECHADRLHACAAYIHSDTPAQIFQFIQCTVKHNDWKTNPAEAANQCVNQVDGWVDAYPEIEFCSILNDTTDVGIFLLNRAKTSALNITNVPTITVKGQLNSDAEKNLINILNKALADQGCDQTLPNSNGGSYVLSNKWLTLLIVILLFIWTKN